MKHKLINVHTLNLIIILAVSFGISSLIYFTPQTTTIYPITPFMSYYNKYTYTQGDNGDPGAKESGTATTLVWVSKIFNFTTIEISELDIQTILTIPFNFTEIKTYQVDLVTGKTNDSNNIFIYWTLPYWNLANLASDTPFPIIIGNRTNFAISEQNMIVLELIRNTKVSWFLSADTISVANYDIYSGTLIEYKARTGNTIEIYQLQSIQGINLGIDFKYYGLMILLFSLVPALIIYLLILFLNLRKKPKKEKVRPLERGQHRIENQESSKIMTSKEEK